MTKELAVTLPLNVVEVILGLAKDSLHSHVTPGADAVELLEREIAEVKAAAERQS